MSSDSTDDYRSEFKSNLSITSNHSRKRSCVFKEHLHARHLLSGLDRLRQHDQFFDVTLRVQGEEFKCHKCLLATLSPYFNAMFLHDLAENKQDVITINGVDSCAMHHLLNYAYTSETLITEENVQSLLSAANLFAILPVRDACCRYLKRHIDECNCIGINAFAELHSCEDLRDASMNFILAHFLEVSCEEEFYGLSAEKLLDLISDDRLNVNNELDVFRAIIRWYMHDILNRKNNLLTLVHLLKTLLHESFFDQKPFFLNAQLTKEVRFPLLSAYELEDAIEMFPAFLRESDVFRDLVTEARRYMLLVNRRSEFRGNRFRYRNCYGVHEVITLFSRMAPVTGTCTNSRSYSILPKCYNVSTGEWKELAGLPLGLYNYGVASTDDNVFYVCGGIEYKKVRNWTFKYEFRYNLWKQLENMRTVRCHHGVCILDGNLYVIGGSESVELTASISCESFNLNTNQWREMPSLLCPVIDPAVCARFPRIYVFGGDGQHEKNGSGHCVQCYDTIANVWFELDLMSGPCCFASCCIWNFQIFIVGGYCSENGVKVFNKMQIYNLRSNSWNDAAVLPRLVTYCTVLLINGNLAMISQSAEESCLRLEYYDAEKKCFENGVVMSKEKIPFHGIVRSYIKWAH